MKDKIKALSITLQNLEGNTIQNRLVTHIQTEENKNLFELATNTLRDWSWSAPKSGCGYNKIDFKIKFENGNTYQGRYDLTQNWFQDEGTLSEHIKKFLTFYIKNPSHLEEKEWKNYIAWVTQNNPNFINECRDFLENYQLE